MAEQNQNSLGLESAGGVENVNEFKFEPIKGYPMLNWRGKRPFTSTQYYPAQLKEIYGDEVDGWRNKLYWGDNLQVMSHLLKEFRGKVDLIYIDPPFDSKAVYKKTIEVKGLETKNDQSTFEEKQYIDIWSNDEYLQFMYERLILMRELLSEKGCILVHCDWHKNHHIRCLMDEVFGDSRIVNEIIWCYTRPAVPNQKNFSRVHDNIYFYSKSSNYKFNADEVRIPYSQASLDRAGYGGGASKMTGGAGVELKDGGKISEDWWDIPVLKGNSKEYEKYPTQKPEKLLERIIKGLTDSEDLVFDCFMGSGTTQAVAMKLGRRFIGADINLGAIQTTTKRLLKVLDESRQNLLDSRKRNFGLEIYNVNYYDIFRNPVEAKDLLIEALEVQKLEFNTIFDGEKDGRMVKIMPVNRICTKADLGELISGFDYKTWQSRQNDKPNQPVEKMLLVCMGHEPSLKAELEYAAKPFKIDVEVLDILRDKSNLEFKRDSEALIVQKNGELVIERFYPMNLLQKLSLQKETVTDWREMVESVMIDWNYDGAVLQPTVVDIPEKNELVDGKYKVPGDAGTIRVKITDVLSESWEGGING